MGRHSPAEKRTFLIDLPHTGETSLWDLGLTLVYTFYNDFRRLNLQQEVWNNYTDDLKKKINIVLVDDCSKIPLHTKIEPTDLDITVYRIKEDLKWNIPGAINLGITQAKTDWILNFASDCSIESDELTKLMDLKPETSTFYKMFRRRITNDISAARRRFEPHSEVFVHNKSNFLDMGGFDEDFTGSRSGGYAVFDNYFNEKTLYFGYKLALINNVRMIEWLEDIGGENIQQKTGVDGHTIRINKLLFGEKKKLFFEQGKDAIRSPMLRFEWEKVYG